MAIMGPSWTKPINFVCISWLLQNIILNITVVATFQSIRVNNTKLLIEDHPSTPLFIHILVFVFRLHMLP